MKIVHNNNNPSSLHFSKQSAPKKQESAEEHRGPRGRGKGMTSKKITSAKKSAVDFRKERKKSEEHGDEEVYEGKWFPNISPPMFSLLSLDTFFCKTELLSILCNDYVY